MVREEVLDFQKISELRAMQHLIELLRRRIGSPISYRNLSKDLSISPNTIKKYIEVLESLYIIFRITPFSKKSKDLFKENLNCIYFHQKYGLPITQWVRYARHESIDRGVPILPLEKGLLKLIL